MYYTTIKKLPYEKWIAALEGELTALRLNQKYGNEKLDEKAYINLMDEYISIFGHSEQFKKIWLLRLKLARLNSQYLKDFNNNRHLLTDIEILEDEINKLNKEGENIGFADVVAQMLNNGRNIPNGLSVYMVEKMIRNGK
jgi:hypothetical protein